MSNAIRLRIRLPRLSPWGCLRCLCHCRSRGNSPSPIRRQYSTREREPVTFDVTCGSAGSISIDIYNSYLLEQSTAPLLIYFPPTGSHLRQTHPTVPSHLFSYSNALARINYRWNNVPPPPRSSLEGASPSPLPLSTHPSYANHPFPYPLHDALHAYTYLTTNLLPSLTYRTESPFSEPYTSKFSPRSAYYTPPSKSKNTQRPLLIYGSYLGGTLATSLALTESFASRQLPVRIAGLIVKNGILDWSGIGTSLPPENTLRREITEEEWNEQTLHALKEKLFTNPASTFDAFASPTLFFRTAGLNVPREWPGTEPPPSIPDFSEIWDDSDPNLPPQETSSSPPLPETVSQTSEPSYSSPVSTHSPTSESPPSEININKTTTTLEPEVPRKAHLKYPPHNSGLRIPRTLFLTSSTEKASSGSKAKRGKKSEKEISMGGQAEEMADLMRRSVLLHEFKERRAWDEDFDAEVEAEGRVVVRNVGNGDEAGVVGEWVEDVLE